VTGQTIDVEAASWTRCRFWRRHFDGGIAAAATAASASYSLGQPHKLVPTAKAHSALLAAAPTSVDKFRSRHLS